MTLRNKLSLNRLDSAEATLTSPSEHTFFSTPLPDCQVEALATVRELLSSMRTVVGTVVQHTAQHTGDLVSPCIREPSVG